MAKKVRHQWDFYRDGISSSTMQLWLSCREQFRLQIVEGWRNRRTPHYFRYGSMVHWVLERAYMKEVPPRKDWWIEKIREYHKLWKKSRTNYTEFDFQQMEEMVGIAEIILPAYALRWQGDWPKGMKPKKSATVTPHRWTATENRFSVKFPLADGKSTLIRGTIDGQFQDRKGQDWSFDTKCRSVIVVPDIQETLAHDIQQMLYLWVQSKTSKTLQGMLLNIVRRPQFRRGKNETLKAALDRLARTVVPKNYDHWFQRFELTVTRQEIKDWEQRFLRPVLLDMQAWWDKKTPHYYNPNALTTKYGRCEMFEPITAGNFTRCYQQTGDVMDYQEEMR